MVVFNKRAPQADTQVIGVAAGSVNVPKRDAAVPVGAGMVMKGSPNASNPTVSAGRAVMIRQTGQQQPMSMQAMSNRVMQSANAPPASSVVVRKPEEKVMVAPGVRPTRVMAPLPVPMSPAPPRFTPPPFPGYPPTARVDMPRAVPSVSAAINPAAMEQGVPALAFQAFQADVSKMFEQVISAVNQLAQNQNDLANQIGSVSGAVKEAMNAAGGASQNVENLASNVGVALEKMNSDLANYGEAIASLTRGVVETFTPRRVTAPGATRAIIKHAGKPGRPTTSQGRVVEEAVYEQKHTPDVSENVPAVDTRFPDIASDYDLEGYRAWYGGHS